MSLEWCAYANIQQHVIGCQLWLKNLLVWLYKWVGAHQW